MSAQGLQQSVRAVLDGFVSVFEEAQTIWRAGGWAMIAIAAIALVMFCVGLRVWVKLRRKRFRAVSEPTWRRWIEHPEERRGPVGRLVERVRDCRTLPEIAAVFDAIDAEETAPFERDLKVMKVCVSAAPLVGLLGTVIGMLTTFGALSTGGGGDETMGMVAAGISEALITTETGLVIALPGLFFQYHLARQVELYRVFLAHLQSVCTQLRYRELQAPDQGAVRRAASEQVARALYERVRAHAAPPAPAKTHVQPRALAHAGARS